MGHAGTINKNLNGRTNRVHNHRALALQNVDIAAVNHDFRIVGTL